MVSMSLSPRPDRFTSSIASVGVPPEGQLATEETAFNGWHYANDYVLSKYISEQMVRGLIAEGLPATIVCPGFPFGPGDRMPTPTGKLIISILQGKMKNYWDGGVCPVDVRDVAEVIVRALNKEGNIGEKYFAGAEMLSFAEFNKYISNASGVSLPRIKMPTWMVMMKCSSG